MTFWYAAALVGMLAIAGCRGSSSDSSATPSGASVTGTATASAGVTPEVSCGDKTCVPTATAPASCGFGTGDWGDCEKTAVRPAMTDFSTRYHPPANSLAVFIEERIDWPDSCLGVDTPGVACLQVITPGFRFVLTGPPGTPYAEYHTDLNGHAVFVAEYATYQDVPPTQTPH